MYVLIQSNDDYINLQLLILPIVSVHFVQSNWQSDRKQK